VKDVLPCPRCGEFPQVSQDDAGLWDAIHVTSHWLHCGTPMALNWPSRGEAIAAWNEMMIRRKGKHGP